MLLECVRTGSVISHIGHAGQKVEGYSCSLQLPAKPFDMTLYYWLLTKYQGIVMYWQYSSLGHIKEDKKRKKKEKPINCLAEKGFSRQGLEGWHPSVSKTWLRIVIGCWSRAKDQSQLTPTHSLQRLHNRNHWRSSAWANQRPGRPFSTEAGTPTTLSFPSV